MESSGAEHLDVALLNPDIPDIERETDRSKAERQDGTPLPERVGPDGDFEEEVADGRQDGGGEAEAGDGFAGDTGETA